MMTIFVQRPNVLLQGFLRGDIGLKNRCRPLETLGRAEQNEDKNLKRQFRAPTDQMMNCFLPDLLNVNVRVSYFPHVHNSA